MATRNAVKEKVRLNGVDYEITLTPATTNDPTTLNTPITPSQPTTPQEVVRRAPAVTELPRWEDGIG